MSSKKVVTNTLHWHALPVRALAFTTEGTSELFFFLRDLPFFRITGYFFYLFSMKMKFSFLFFFFTIHAFETNPIPILSFLYS